MENVIATDIRHLETNKVCTEGIFEILDVTDADALGELYNKYKPDTLIHLASLLSATAEGCSPADTPKSFPIRLARWAPGH